MLSVNSPPRVCYCALVSFWHFFPHSCWSIPDFIGPTSYPLIFVFGVGPAVGHPNLDSLLPKKAFDMWIRADFWATHFTWETRLPQRLPDGTYNPAWLAARRWRLTAGRFVSVRRVGQHRRLAKEGSCGKHGEWWDEVQNRTTGRLLFCLLDQLATLPLMMFYTLKCAVLVARWGFLHCCFSLVSFSHLFWDGKTDID